MDASLAGRGGAGCATAFKALSKPAGQVFLHHRDAVEIELYDRTKDRPFFFPPPLDTLDTLDLGSPAFCREQG